MTFEQFISQAFTIIMLGALWLVPGAFATTYVGKLIKKIKSKIGMDSNKIGFLQGIFLWFIWIATVPIILGFLGIMPFSIGN